MWVLSILLGPICICWCTLWWWEDDFKDLPPLQRSHLYSAKIQTPGTLLLWSSLGNLSDSDDPVIIIDSKGNLSDSDDEKDYPAESESKKPASSPAKGTVGKSAARSSASAWKEQSQIQNADFDALFGWESRCSQLSKRTPICSCNEAFITAIRTRSFIAWSRRASKWLMLFLPSKGSAGFLTLASEWSA